MIVIIKVSGNSVMLNVFILDALRATYPQLRFRVVVILRRPAAAPGPVMRAHSLHRTQASTTRYFCFRSLQYKPKHITVIKFPMKKPPRIFRIYKSVVQKKNSEVVIRELRSCKISNKIKQISFLISAPESGRVLSGQVFNLDSTDLLKDLKTTRNGQNCWVKLSCV